MPHTPHQTGQEGGNGHDDGYAETLKQIRPCVVDYIESEHPLPGLNGPPVLVQLVWVYYCLPILLDIDLNAVTSCIVALSLHGGAYVGEIIRAGIQSIDRGQLETARSIGLSYPQLMRTVVLPQAFRRVIPPLANEGVTLLKYSSLVSTLGVADLTYNAQVVATTTFRPLEVYTFLAIEYLVLCLFLSYGAHRLEVKLARSD